MGWWTSFRDKILKPVAAIVATIYLGPAVGSALLGEAVAAGTVSTLMATAVGTAVVSGTITAVQGGSASDVLKAAVMAGAGSYIGGTLAEALKGSGVSAAALEAANATADPVAALNASQAWTIADIPYLQSIGATPGVISAAIASNLTKYGVAATAADVAVESFAKTSVMDPWHYDAMVKAHVDPTTFVQSGVDAYGNPLYAFKDAAGELVSSKTLFQTPEPGYSFDPYTGQQVLTDTVAAEAAIRAKEIAWVGRDFYNDGSIIIRGADGSISSIIPPQEAMNMVRDLQRNGLPIPEYLQEVADAMAAPAQPGAEVTAPTTTTPVEPVQPVGTEVTAPVSPTGVDASGNNVSIPNADGSVTNPETGEITYPDTRANGVDASGNNVSIPNADGSVTNPETGEITYPDANTDTSVNPNVNTDTGAPVEDRSGTAIPGTNNPLGEGNPDLLGAITRLGAAGLEALGLGGLTPGQIATLVAAGVLAPAVITALTGKPPSTEPAGYEPLAPMAPSTYVPRDLARPGLNPGLITPVKAYDTTNPVQNQYAWEVKPYMQTAADLANYNINAAAQPYGLQQPRAPLDVDALIRATVNPQTRAAAQGGTPTPFAEPAAGPVDPVASAPITTPIQYSATPVAPVAPVEMQEPNLGTRLSSLPKQPPKSYTNPSDFEGLTFVPDVEDRKVTDFPQISFTENATEEQKLRAFAPYMTRENYEKRLDSIRENQALSARSQMQQPGAQPSNQPNENLAQAPITTPIQYSATPVAPVAPVEMQAPPVQPGYVWDPGLGRYVNPVASSPSTTPVRVEMQAPPVPMTPTAPPPAYQPDPVASVDTGLQPGYVWDPGLGRYVNPVASTSGSQRAVRYVGTPALYTVGDR